MGMSFHRAARRPFWLFAVFAFIAANGAGGAAVTSMSASDAAFQALLDARVAGTPGVGIIVGIVDGDRTAIYQAGTTGTSRPLDDRTEFEIGSVTKTFTATLLASMVLDHSVFLSDPVAKYLPTAVHVPSRDGKQITLLNLATQHSGLPRLPTNLDPTASDPYATYHENDLFAFLDGYALPRDPGSDYEYSNLGIGLLGDALALRERRSYIALLRRRVLGPLGMSDTATGLDAGQRQRFAIGHTLDGDVAPPWTFDAIAPAGALRSTIRDMLKYVRCNMGQGPLARACLFAQMPRDTIPGNHIGLVWEIGDVRPIVHHGGDTAGYHAAVAVSPDHRKGVVVLSNGGLPVEDIAFHALDARFGVASLPAGVALDPSILDAYVGEYHTHEPDPNLTFTIRHRGNHLTVQLIGQPEFRLYASAKDHFFLRVVDAQIDFLPDPLGHVNGLVLHQGGKTILALRQGYFSPSAAPPPGSPVPTPTPTQTPTPMPSVMVDPQVLESYVGRYLVGPSVEFIVKREGDTLLVELTGQQFNPVYASAKDHFFYTVVNARIDFLRDRNGSVSGLVLHQNGQDVPAVRE
jgi:CubicO group peptidase (beta-lactamase class C family)